MLTVRNLLLVESSGSLSVEERLGSRSIGFRNELVVLPLASTARSRLQRGWRKVPTRRPPPAAVPSRDEMSHKACKDAVVELDAVEAPDVGDGLPPM